MNSIRIKYNISMSKSKDISSFLKSRTKSLRTSNGKNQWKPLNFNKLLLIINSNRPIIIKLNRPIIIKLNRPIMINLNKQLIYRIFKNIKSL